jgi:hypothetical protein
LRESVSAQVMATGESGGHEEVYQLQEESWSVLGAEGRGRLTQMWTSQHERVLVVDLWAASLGRAALEAVTSLRDASRTRASTALTAPAPAPLDEPPSSTLASRRSFGAVVSGGHCSCLEEFERADKRDVDCDGEPVADDLPQEE